MHGFRDCLIDIGLYRLAPSNPRARNLTSNTQTDTPKATLAPPLTPWAGCPWAGSVSASVHPSIIERERERSKFLTSRFHCTCTAFALGSIKRTPRESRHQSADTAWPGTEDISDWLAAGCCAAIHLKVAGRQAPPPGREARGSE
ncbi:uncharacterized protein QC763_0112150 [Podospora pseudopauciseta]|uniref:Uncharacterized protein n=1 Tax=Podospora pseudopauciseta TaxID=2093780 RepID=A0ABR0H2R9_9PEZI|nr:hypothetical protein QC763_0112150 [Podospora pseudopauciseta]